MEKLCTVKVEIVKRKWKPLKVMMMMTNNIGKEKTPTLCPRNGIKCFTNNPKLDDYVSSTLMRISSAHYHLMLMPVQSLPSRTAQQMSYVTSKILRVIMYLIWSMNPMVLSANPMVQLLSSIQKLTHPLIANSGISVPCPMDTIWLSPSFKERCSPIRLMKKDIANVLLAIPMEDKISSG